MSSYLVSLDHACALVTAAREYGSGLGLPEPRWADLETRFPGSFTYPASRPLRPNETNLARVFPTELVRALLLANLDALRSHYFSPDQVARHDECEAWIREASFSERRLEPVSVLRQIHCFTYQACEAPGFDGSWAQEFCRQLETGVIQNLPGYAAAPWGI